MHNSFILFRHLTPVLEARIRGHKLVSCFSQERDELVMEFNDGSDSFFIRAVFGASLTSLSFPSGFRRARKNSAELFGQVILQKVTEVRTFRHERTLLIGFTGGFGLLFKMHGPSGNVILVEQGKPAALFRNRLAADLDLNLSVLDRDLDQSRAAFDAGFSDLRSLYFTFGREVWNWLEDQRFDAQDKEGKWELIQQTFALLDKPSPDYFIIRHQHRIWFSLLPIGEVVAKHTDPIRALNDFQAVFTRETALLSVRGRVVRRLEQLIRQTEAFTERSRQRLAVITGDHHFQEWADLLMANLHQIHPGVKEWTGESFYAPGAFLRIRLNPALTPQKNAEVYYRKARNRNSEMTMLDDVLQSRAKSLNRYQELLVQALKVGSTKELDEIEAHLPKRQDAAMQEERLPFAEHEFMGFRILVGRSSEDNDVLTFRYGAKNDLWLHARDCPGSHVLIKAKPGQTIPRPVLERAAALAAQHSKRKGESLCPVSYTERKFVRKRKGDPPGMVVLDRETVLMATPAP